MTVLTKPRIARTGIAPRPWLILLPADGPTPMSAAFCATFAQTVAVLDSYVRWRRVRRSAVPSTTLQRFVAWPPHGAALN